MWIKKPTLKPTNVQDHFFLHIYELKKITYRLTNVQYYFLQKVRFERIGFRSFLGLVCKFEDVVYDILKYIYHQLKIVASQHII
jgi:hypothetical protein